MKNGRLSIIVGRLKGEKTTTAQAYRYPKSVWTEEAARAHCSKEGGSFEPAASEKMELTEEMKTKVQAIIEETLKPHLERIGEFLAKKILAEREKKKP